jgi:3-oxoadipate enol-lactonase
MVDALIPVASAVSGYHSSDDANRYFEEEDAALERGDLEGVFEINLWMWVDGPARSPGAVDPALREKVRQMQRDAAISNEAQAHRLDPPAIGRLGEIRAPALVIAGDADVPDMLTIADFLTSGIPGARKAVIHGVAHMVTMERPVEFNRAVLDFLGSH